MNYRKLNDVTKKDCFPLSRMDVNMPVGAKWFSTLDLQVDLHPDNKDKTVFSTGQGLWQFMVLDSATLQQCLSN
jgi:hypothetical protein